MQVAFKFKGWFITAITGLVILLQLIAPARVWTMLLIGLGLFQLFSFIWAKSLQKSLHLVRERRSLWSQVGDRLEERFTITNTGVFPALWVEIIDHSNLPGYSASQVTGVASHGTMRWSSDGVCTRRGVFQLGPTTVNVGDPFGLFNVSLMNPAVIDITVVPAILPLPDLHVATRGNVGEEVPRPFSLAPNQPTATVRAHTPSDSLSRIHWPTSARLDSLYVRGMEETTSGDWWLVLDLDRNVHRGSSSDSSLEKAVLVAASLTDKGLSHNHAVGLLAHGQETVWMLPKPTILQRWHILKVLAQIEAGDLTLNQLLTRSDRLVKRDASLIVITTSPNPEWVNSLLMLRRQGVVPTVVFLYDDTTQAAAEGMQNTLASQMIRVQIIDLATIDLPTAEEFEDQWEWRILGTGRAVAVHKPEEVWEQI